MRLAALFTDGMVLQRDCPIPVWGWANAGQTITVVLAGRSARATAGRDGRWKAVLPALPAGGLRTTTKVLLHSLDRFIREFAAVVAHKPIDPAEAHYQLARAYHLDHQTDKAQDELLVALEAAPSYRPAQKLLLELSGAEKAGTPGEPVKKE